MATKKKPASIENLFKIYHKNSEHPDAQYFLPGITYSLQVESVELDPTDHTHLYLSLRLKDDEVGAIRFYVYHAPSKTYTSIGARNIHHAANKVTKLFRGDWTGLTKIKPAHEKWTFKTVKEFGQLIKEAL